MGSDLYRVKAVSKRATTAVFDVKVTHPDISTIPEDRSFALMLLREASDRSLLAREVTTTDMKDKAWLKKYASGFIPSVELTPIGRSTKRGRLTVTVSDPAWLDHIKPGESFDTAAFQRIDKYDRHPPILLTKGAAEPPAVDDSTLDAGEGFLWVPREAYGDVRMVKPLPPFVQVPAYSLSAYEVVGDMSGKFAAKRLQAWHGKAVRVMVSRRPQEGALGLLKGSADKFALLTLTGWGWSKVEAIGRLRLKPGRRGTKASYAEVLERVRVSATLVKKRGRTLELTCRLPPDGRKVPFASESDALALLARPLEFDFFAQGFKTKAPLGDALTRDLREQSLGTDEELYPAVARAYVASFTVEGATKPKKKLTAAALDALTPPAALAALSAAWPTFTLRIEVTDPKWIAHVDDELPMFADDTVLAKPATPKQIEAAKAAAKASAAEAKAKARAPGKPAPKRVILWLKKGTSDKVWIASQDGATWKAQYGRRVLSDREEKVHELASEEKASAAFTKAVEAKKRDGYQVAPTYDAAAELLWKRLGLAFDDTSGEPVVTRVGPPASAATHFETGFKAGDIVDAARHRGMASPYRLRTIEELAVVVESRRAGEDVLLETSRKLGKSGMMTTARVTLR